MNHADYLTYLQSDHWQETRRQALRRANYRCQICGAAVPLDVHHWQYQNIGAERPEDLVCVCRSCHRRLHGERGRNL